MHSRRLPTLMAEGRHIAEAFRFCDVALPVPLDRLFTYEVPLPLRERARTGSRVPVPFGTRKLTGIILDAHDQAPEQETREILTVIDDEPVLDSRLLALARWIAEYYCAPLGEVVKSMLPLTGETRRTSQYTLTEAGRDVVRQLIVTEESDSASRILAALMERPLTLETLSRKIRGARDVMQALIKRGWVTMEEHGQERDPLRASAARLQAEFVQRPAPETKLNKT